MLDTIVLHSGGLDSTVCLLTAIKAGKSVLSLGIDYGQKHRIELEYANNQCSKLNIPRKVIRVEWDKPIRDIPVNRRLDEIRSGVSSAFLPGRNAIFLAMACAEASGMGANEVWSGINSIDFSGYPDCRPEFIAAFQKMILEAIPNGPVIIAPLLSKTKPEIAEEARKLGLSKGDTWSCYQPTFSKEGIIPCSKCDACILHNYAWNNVNFMK